MGFRKKKMAFNIYDEPSGSIIECTVCKKTAFRSNRNDDHTEPCSNVRLVRHWDDTEDLIHVDCIDVEQDVAIIQYQDGTKESLSISHLEEITIARY